MQIINKNNKEQVSQYQSSSAILKQVKYIITKFRTKQYYLIFQIIQLLLAIIIIFSALTNINHFKTSHVIWMQFMLLILMTIDLFIIRLVSQGTLIKDTLSKIDLVIYIIFAMTLLILSIVNSVQSSQQQSEQDQLLQTDDIIIIFVVISRYILQIYNMVKSIKQTQTNRIIQNHIKQIDLNLQPNLSQVYHNQHDDVFKNKIINNINQNHKRNALVEEE